MSPPPPLPPPPPPPPPCHRHWSPWKRRETSRSAPAPPDQSPRTHNWWNARRSAACARIFRQEICLLTRAFFVPWHDSSPLEPIKASGNVSPAAGRPALRRFARCGPRPGRGERARRRREAQRQHRDRPGDLRGLQGAKLAQLLE